MIHVYHHHSKLPIENENLTGIKIKLNKHFFSLPEGGKVGNGGEILAKKIITDSSVMQKISSGSRQTNTKGDLKATHLVHRFKQIAAHIDTNGGHCSVSAGRHMGNSASSTRTTELGQVPRPRPRFVFITLSLFQNTPLSSFISLQLLSVKGCRWTWKPVSHAVVVIL